MDIRFRTREGDLMIPYLYNRSINGKTEEMVTKRRTLSGRRIIDRRGLKEAWSISYKEIPQQDYDYLKEIYKEACRGGMVMTLDGKPFEIDITPPSWSMDYTIKGVNYYSGVTLTIEEV